jgi:hypothetical protein
MTGGVVSAVTTVMIVATTGARIVTDLISRRNRRCNVTTLTGDDNPVFKRGDVTRTLHGPRHILFTVDSLNALFLPRPTCLTARSGISRESRE